MAEQPRFEIRSKPAPPIKGRPWEPKFPEVAVPIPQGVIPEADADDFQGDEPWTPAPASSHLLEFRLWDRRKYAFIRKFGPHGGASQLEIRFRAKGRRPVAGYVYYITDGPAKAAEIFAEMAAAESPGTISKAKVEGVYPYHPVAEIHNR